MRVKAVVVYVCVCGWIVKRGPYRGEGDEMACSGCQVTRTNTRSEENTRI